jgi:hypothetical protein
LTPHRTFIIRENVHDTTKHEHIKILKEPVHLESEPYEPEDASDLPYNILKIKIPPPPFCPEENDL